MPEQSKPDSGAALPDWALAQAMDGLNEEDNAGREARARRLVHDFESERHDEDDDADQGGEG